MVKIQPAYDRNLIIKLIKPKGCVDNSKTRELETYKKNINETFLKMKLSINVILFYSLMSIFMPTLQHTMSKTRDDSKFIQNSAFKKVPLTFLNI